MNDSTNNFIPNNGSSEPNGGNGNIPSDQPVNNRYNPYSVPNQTPPVQGNPAPNGETTTAFYGYTSPDGQYRYVRQNPTYTQSAPSSAQPVTPPPVSPDTSVPADGNQKKKKDKKSKKVKKPTKGGDTGGFFIFLIIAIVVSVLAVILCVFIAMGGNVAANPTETLTHTPGSDDTEITISASPTLGENSDSLTTIQIAENAEKINVGIMIYEKTQSFISNSTTSLIGEGSGIIMGADKSGKYTYILTCAHVISDAANPGYSITVQDSDGNTYDGIMVGCDVKTDIGVIKIQATGLPSAEFGDSSALKKGQRVFAIGNPGGMEFFGSFTDGMISSIDRPISSEGGYEMECIQHTTPINSGNSGGALLNEYGQVIGINSSKIVSTGYEGMAFAIPISDAKPIIDDLIAYGYVTNRPKLGISYSPAMQFQQYAMIIKLNDLPAGSLIIRDINKDSALASTKAEVYDLIIAVNGEPLDTADVLLDKIENGKVGDELTLTLCRVNDDYSVSKFDVKIKLVADTGSSASNQSSQASNDFWNENFGN